MKTGISEQQELLLLKACQNGGQFSMNLAEQLYSSKQAAQSAVQKLEVLGFVENSAPGVFKVVQVTEDVKKHYKGSVDNSSGKDESKENSSSSGYEAKEVKAV